MRAVFIIVFALIACGDDTSGDVGGGPTDTIAPDDSGAADTADEDSGDAAGDAQRDVPGANGSPVWSDAPAPRFRAGEAGSFALSGVVADPDGDALTFALRGCALSAGLSLDDGIVHDGSAAVGSIAGCIIEANDGVNPSVPSPEFAIVVTDSSALCWAAQGDAEYLPYPANRNGLGCAEISPAIGYGQIWGGYSEWPGTDPDVIHVTNLDDSGSGSLRAALSTSGCRVVVFDVAGEIALETQLGVRNGCLTINGHAAPGPIWLTLQSGSVVNGLLNIRAPNVVVEGLVLNTTPPVTCGNVRAVSVNAVADNVLFLNVALLGASDQNNSHGPADNWQYVDSLFGNPQGDTTCGHAFNFLAEGGPTHGLLLGMVFANSSNRNPRSLVEHQTWFNTYVYNVSQGRVADIQVDVGDSSSPDYFVNISDFWFDAGPDTTSTPPRVIRLGPGGSDMGMGSEFHINRIHVDSGFCPDPWDEACVRNLTTPEETIRHDATDGFPAGARPTDTTGLSLAENQTLMFQNNGPWPNRRSPDLQAIYDGIVSGESRIQDAYRYAPSQDAAGAYEEGPSPHADANANGYPDLMDRFESDRRALYR